MSAGRSRLEGGQGGVLFLPYMAGEIAALRSTISAWMRIAIFEAMSTGEADHRLWFVIDELDALGEIDGLKDALARVRKFGGRCVLGTKKHDVSTPLQSIANACELRQNVRDAHDGPGEKASTPPIQTQRARL